MRWSEYIERRLRADSDFYTYPVDVIIEPCMCQNHCQEWPVVLFDADIKLGMNPVKASDTLRKKIDEAKKHFSEKRKPNENTLP